MSTAAAYRRESNNELSNVIEPTIPQDDFIFAEEAYPAFVAGFGAGKTEALILRALIGKIINACTNRAFYEPTYDLMRVIAWPRFEEILETNNMPFKLFRSPHNILNIEGAGKIIFRSMDTPQRIIGYEVADSDIDELDTLKPKDAAEVWRRVLSRNRQKKPDGSVNTIGVATTPEGFGHVHKHWGQGKANRKGYRLIQAPTYSNPHLPEGYIQSLRDIYPENLIEAYIEGIFVNLANGTIYNSYNRLVHTCTAKVRPLEQLRIGMDFNVTKQVAIVYVVRNGKWLAVDEFVDMYDTPSTIDAIKAKYGGHSIIVYPDASGNSRKTVDASLSDILLLREAGFSIRAHASNPRVKNRIMSTNAAFQNKILYVNEEACPVFSSCLEKQTYKDNGDPDKSNGVDHANDAGTYPIVYEMPIVKPIIITDIRMGR
jgi:phage terminase large subunit